MFRKILDFNFFENLLRDCGRMLIELYDTGAGVGFWDGNQFKAKADLMAHDFICSRLLRRFPDIPILSEEGINHEVPEEDYFLIDPIDGTASYSHGFSGWVTQLTYMSDGKSKFACIYAPKTDEYFFSATNMGAFCNGERINIKYGDPTIRSIIDNYPQPCGVALDIYNDLNIQKYIESGSLALKVCRVADGTADLFLKDMSPRDWDIAGAALILEEAGGVMSDINGCDLKLGGVELAHDGLIVAANRLIFNRVVDWRKSKQ